MLKRKLNPQAKAITDCQSEIKETINRMYLQGKPQADIERAVRKIIKTYGVNELAKLIATSDESKYKVITEYIKEKYGGNFMMFPDGSFARIDNNDAKKLSYNADDKRAAEISVLSKLIENSFLGNITDLPNDEHGKFNRFKYYYVQTKYKGQLSYVCLNIGRVKNAKDEWHFYTITKKEPPPTH